MLYRGQRFGDYSTTNMWRLRRSIYVVSLSTVRFARVSRYVEGVEYGVVRTAQSFRRQFWRQAKN